MSPAGLARLGRRFAVMLGGEGLQSLFHLGLNLALVRALPAQDYGIFAIVFTLGGIALTFVRAAAGVPAATFIPQARSARAAKAHAVAFGSGALLLSLALGLGAAALLAPFLGAGAGPAGAFVGLWCLRSYLRIFLFVRGRPALAGVSDLAFTLSGTVLLALVLRGGGDLLRESLAVLAAAHGLGIALALGLLREPVRVGLRHTGRRYRGLWRSFAWSVAGVATANLQAQGQILLVGLLAGPAAYAPIAAVLVLFAPLRLLGTVVVNLVQPEMAAALAAGDGRHLRRLAAASTAGLAAACLAYGGLVALAFPLVEGQLLAGRFAGEPLAPIAAFVWLTVLASLLYAAPKTLLETRRAFPELARMALASAALGMALVAILLVAAAPAWSMAGVAASELLVLVWCWRAARLPRSAPLPGTGAHPSHAAA